MLSAVEFNYNPPLVTSKVHDIFSRGRDKKTRLPRRGGGLKLLLVLLN
jgi:hypothetical protein